MSDQEPGPTPPDRRMTDLGGIFFPVGYLVAAFPEESHARQVQRDLRTGGYEEADCVFYSSEEVAKASRENLEQHTSWLSQLGKSDEAVRAHLASAKRGAAFLLIYAPGEIDSARAMNVIRRVPFEFVHRYHRLAIEEME
jgi:hypothetical protein